MYPDMPMGSFVNIFRRCLFLRAQTHKATMTRTIIKTDVDRATAPEPLRSPSIAALSHCSFHSLFHIQT